MLALTLGCSVFRSSHQTISISVTDPPDAGVWVNGNYEGEAPVNVSVMRNTMCIVEVKKKGFIPMRKAIQTDINVTGVLDAVGTYIFLLPVIGVASAGSQSLKETDLVLRLAPDDNLAASTNASAATK